MFFEPHEDEIEILSDVEYGESWPLSIAVIHSEDQTINGALGRFLEHLLLYVPCVDVR